MVKPIRFWLRARQGMKVTALVHEARMYAEVGNEYYAQLVQGDIVVAASLARLVHK